MSEEERKTRDRLYSFAYRLRHLEHVRAIKRAYYWNHREEVLARARARRKAKPNENKEQCRKYYARNRLRIREVRRRYRAANTERIREVQRVWIARNRKRWLECKRLWMRKWRAQQREQQQRALENLRYATAARELFLARGGRFAA